MKKKQVSDEMYFVIWRDGEDIFEAAEYPSLEKALAAAKGFLADNVDLEGVFWVAKAVKKFSYEVKEETF